MRGGRTCGILSAALIGLFFSGCGKPPGEKLYLNGLEQWKQGNRVRARALFEKSISRRIGSGVNADAHNSLGLLLWEMGEAELAVEHFEKSLQINRNNFAVLCNLGVAQSAIKELSAAEKSLREAVLLNPIDPRPTAYTGIIYARNGKWEDAERNLRRAAGRDPDNPRLQTALALAELHTKGAEPALSRLLQLVEKHPDFEPALFNTAAIYRYGVDDPALARQWFERYLEHASGVDAFSALARAQLRALEEPAESPSLSLRTPVDRDRKKAEAHFRQAVASHKAGQMEAAIEAYIHAVEADDTYDRAFYNLGLVYYTRGKMELAAESFARAVRLNPAFIEARYNLALVRHYHLGNTPDALFHLKVIRSQQPDYQPAVDLIAQIQGR